jgi:hypothetical protein
MVTETLLMRLSLQVNSTGELKKRSYLPLKKMQQLENGRRVGQIYSRHVGNNIDDLYVIRCLGHLRNLIEYSCSNLKDQGVNKRLERVLSRIDRVIEEVRDRRSFDNKLLKRVSVGELLNSHTELFNFLLKRDYRVSINFPEWVNTTNTAIAIWGDNIAPKRGLERGQPAG